MTDTLWEWQRQGRGEWLVRNAGRIRYLPVQVAAGGTVPPPGPYIAQASITLGAGDHIVLVVLDDYERVRARLLMIPDGPLAGIHRGQMICLAGTGMEPEDSSGA